LRTAIFKLRDWVVSLLLMALPAASSAEELIRLPVARWAVTELMARLFDDSAFCADKACIFVFTVVMVNLQS
jgi:hypothetical protein